MEEKEILMNEKKLWVLLLMNFIFLIYGALSKVYHWAFSDFFLGFAKACFFIAWGILLYDMFRNKIFNKTFWIISMFFIPQISSIIYLLQRRKLLKAGD